MTIDGKKLARICARAKSLRHHCRVPAADPEDISGLTTELANLFWAMDLLDDGTSERALWLELSRETTPHADLAASFKRMGQARNPIAPEVCSGDIAKIFQRKLAMHWARKARTQDAKNSLELDHLDWDQLTSQERFEIRRMARDLAVYHRGFISQHRPRKDRLDTLLWELADIFARHAGRNDSVLLLPSAERSLFIQFCHVALKPLSGRDAPFDPSEVSLRALSRRWFRLIKHAREDPGPVKPRPRRRLPPRQLLQKTRK